MRLYEVWSVAAGRDPRFVDQRCEMPSEAQAPTPTPVVTPGMVLEAFRRIPLPESVLVVQPPEGETLVNFETNFYTEAEPFERTVRLLGQQVRLRIRPDRFTWVHGDGSSQAGDDPGAAYPDLRVTHVYVSKGRYQPRVDTTWSATYSVGGGPWRAVDGTVTMQGRPEALRALEAQPNLVAG